MYERSNIFAETAAPGAIAHKRSPGADAIIRCDTQSEIVNIDIGDFFADLCTNAVPERYIGQQHCVGDVFNRFGRFGGGLDVFDANVMYKLWVDPAKDFKIFFMIAAHYDAIGSAGLIYSGSFR